MTLMHWIFFWSYWLTASGVARQGSKTAPTTRCCNLREHTCFVDRKKE